MNSSLVCETISLQYEKQQQQIIFAILKLVKGGGKKMSMKNAFILYGIWRVKEKKVESEKGRHKNVYGNNGETQISMRKNFYG